MKKFLPFIWLLLSEFNLLSQEVIGYKKAVKAAPFSFAQNYFSLTYEFAYKKRKSVEFTAGIIGVVKNKVPLNYNDVPNEIEENTGMLGKLTLKNFFSNKLNKTTQFLSGSYYYLEGGVSSFRYYYFRPPVYLDPTTKELNIRVYSFNLLVGLGQQWVVRKRFIFTLNGGVGANFSNFNKQINHSYPVHLYNSYLLGENSRFAYKFEFKVGYTFGK